MKILTKIRNLINLVGWIAFPIFCIYFKIQMNAIANILGFAYPACWTISAIESPNKKYRKVLLIYWIVFCVSSLMEHFSLTILRFIPAYYTIKIGVILWIILIPKPSHININSNKNTNQLTVLISKTAVKKEMKIKSCVICLEEVPLISGYACTGNTEQNCNIFTCWSCIEESYKAANKADAIISSVNKEGALVCPNLHCNCAITLIQLLPANPPIEIINELQCLQIKTHKEQAIQAALAQQKAQIHAEYMRIEQIKDQDEKTAAKLHQRIVEEVLTLKCPRCAQAFQDFDGCFALTCGNKHCSAGFCAWCLTDCGSDAHAHVLICIENPKQQHYYNTFEMFERHHKQRKIQQIKEIITTAQLTPTAISKLYTILVGDLRDLQINSIEIFPEEAQAGDVNVPAVEIMGFNAEDYVENWED